MKTPTLPILLLLALPWSMPASAQESGATSRPATHRAKPAFRTVHGRSSDGLPLTADLYPARSPKALTILLFHQAGSSRGEYRSIAPRLQAAGYNSLALDARSGRAMFGVRNETAAEAARRKLPASYEDAEKDLVATISWARKLGLRGPLVLWGSSYSASLVLRIGRPEVQGSKLAAILSFSPGEYLRQAGKGAVRSAVAKLKVPIFVTCAARERGPVSALFKAQKNPHSKLFVPERGTHGSRTLLAADGEKTWQAVLGFLTSIDAATRKVRPAGSAKTRTDKH